MISGLFMAGAFISLYAFMTLSGFLSRPLYLKLAFDFAAVAALGLSHHGHSQEGRIISICMVVIGLGLTFLYLIIQRQKDASDT